MRTERLEAPLTGWRSKFADAIADPVSRRTRFNRNQIRAVLGALFFLKSALYVAKSIRRAARR